MKLFREKLDLFIKTNKIPHIIFYGANGSGKRTVVNEFVKRIYDHDMCVVSEYTMYVNCAHGKGIKFVREELSLFCKRNINHLGGRFKTIILLNADELTVDAQSALRRSIELHSHHTRFFIVVENKSRLLRPILSRLCEIRVTSASNLHVQSNNQYVPNLDKEKTRKISKYIKQQNVNISTLLYEKGLHGGDMMNWFEQKCDHPLKYQHILAYQKAAKVFRNEKLFMLFITTFSDLRFVEDLESIDEI
jgi:DNA polymerase III delta prime subunit